MTLPPLPPSRTLSRGDDDGPLQLGYTADQMRAYGEACAAAERERCLDICEQHYLDKYPVQEITAAIRAQEKTP